MIRTYSPGLIAVMLLTGAALSAKCDQQPEIAEKYLNLAVNSPSGSDSVVQYILAYECPPDNSL